MLKFSKANTKLRSLYLVCGVQPYLHSRYKVYSLDLLSGHYCPFADKCKSKVVIVNNQRKIQDGNNTEFRCFSASQEAILRNVYNLRLHNSETIRKCKNKKEFVELITKSMPEDLGICRIHVSGDFFSQTHFDAWLEVAQNNKKKLFYAYTKSLPYWLRRKDEIDQMDNFILTASYGGTADNLINIHNLRSATVVFSEVQAESLRLEIDHDDSHAADPTKKLQSFALLIHNTQPKGSMASKAKYALRGKGSYGKGNK